MNILLFDSDEISEGSQLVLEDRRAEYLADIQGVEPGDLLTVGEINGKIGQGEVLEVSSGEIRLRVFALEQSCSQNPLDLIVALPRPQMLKRILQNAATMGVRRLMFIRSERVIKSYFSTPVLADESIREHLLLGLEQGVSTLIPEVSIHPRFRPFVEDELHGIVDKESICLLAHTAAKSDISELNLVRELDAVKPLCLAIGPEGGWQAHEVLAFEQAGFIGCGLGDRVLRVETAVVSLLGQVELLRKLN